MNKWLTRNAGAHAPRLEPCARLTNILLFFLPLLHSWRTWKLIRVAFLSSLLFLSLILIGQASSTTYQVDPSLVVLGETGSVLGTLFTVNMTVSDAVNLEGFDLLLSWNTTYLDYWSHQPKIPVETYPDGVLHEPVMFVKDEVNPIAGTYWLAAATLGGEPFNGDGTVFEITFRVIDQPPSGQVPPPPNNYVSLPLELQETVTPCEDGEVRLYSLPPTHPPYPLVKLLPEVIGDKQMNETFPLDVWLLGERGLDLDPFFDVSGADIHLQFNSSLIEALSVTIDPDGWFASFWTSSLTEIAKEVNNTAGTVRVCFNASDEMHMPVYGRGRIASVEVRALSESSMWPPPSCTLGLKNPPPHPVILGVETQVHLEGYQHPERDFSPWNSSNSRVPLPHFVENATYFVRYELGICPVILSPTTMNYSKETLGLNVTANVSIEDWWFSLNNGENASFIANTTITVVEGENNLTIYASAFGMTSSASIQFFALTGDFDGDRDVDIFDIVVIAGVYGVSHPDPQYNVDCDVDNDGDIDIFDIVAAAGNYGKSL
jgi:hypothetical protein